jgi:two-component system, NarL family, nitrate/nitrite sensor histidine kinase NarX
MQIIYKFTERSLLLRLGIAMAAITLLGVIGMASSILIATMTQGNAITIDEAGSLRMQSYRIASLIMVAQKQGTPASWNDVDKAISQFEHTLQGRNLSQITASRSGDSQDNDYRAVATEWQTKLKPQLGGMVSQGRHSLPHAGTEQDNALLQNIGSFVGKIDNLVKLLAEQAETRITLLTTILGISLYITLGVVLFTMYVMHTDVLLPLRNLLTCAEKAGKGDFSVRAKHTGEDELGRLGNAFNVMAEDLSKQYKNLEARVAEKTKDLERSNRSLELLYHSISRLYDAPIAQATYNTLLKDLEQVLDIGHGATCLIDNDNDHAVILASTLNPHEGDPNLCKQKNCHECLKSESLGIRHIGKHGEKQILSIPLHDMNKRYGVLQMEIPQDKKLEEWQTQLLEALSRHIGIAIGTAHRAEQSRRLSLLEERGAIARELHDSLAQSLSYMKIQVSRLQAVMAPHNPAEDANSILSELREGLNSAYRELRELLTTFRLKIEGDGLIPTLEKTAKEFSARGNIPISIETHLGGCQLSANEEIHTMQIVREALANVIYHSHATHAGVTIEHAGDEMISVTIDDDGIGMTDKQSETHHYGMNIMQERARSLGGIFHMFTRETGGTRILFKFKSGTHHHTQPLPQGSFAI